MGWAWYMMSVHHTSFRRKCFNYASVCLSVVWYSMHAYLLVNHGNTMETKPYLSVAWKWYQFFAITISLRRLYDHTATATDASSIPPIHDWFSLISTKCMERYKPGLIIPLVNVSQVRFASTICRNSIQEKCFSCEFKLIEFKSIHIEWETVTKLLPLIVTPTL